MELGFLSRPPPLVVQLSSGCPVGLAVIRNIREVIVPFAAWAGDVWGRLARRPCSLRMEPASKSDPFISPCR